MENGTPPKSSQKPLEIPLPICYNQIRDLGIPIPKSYAGNLRERRRIGAFGGFRVKYAVRGKGKERRIMEVLRGIVTVLYVLLCIALIVVVLMQEGKSAGLSGAINGVADTYWGKNKGRSMEGALEKITKILAALFIIISIVLTMNW